MKHRQKQKEKNVTTETSLNDYTRSVRVHLHVDDCWRKPDPGRPEPRTILIICSNVTHRIIYLSSHPYTYYTVLLSKVTLCSLSN